VIPEDNRFESDPASVIPEDHPLPDGWEPGPVDGGDAAYSVYVASFEAGASVTWSEFALRALQEQVVVLQDEQAAAA